MHPVAISLLLLAAAASGLGREAPPSEPPPIKALLVVGGCSHDYATRREILVRGIRERIARPIEWTSRLQGEGEGDARIPLFESSEWAQGYDIVVHDHCFPRVADPAYIDRALAPHRAGLPAVLLHGTMMSFRDSEPWHDFTGGRVRSHERERPVLVEPAAGDHPLLEGFDPWTVSREELYRIECLQSDAAILASAADPSGKRHPVAWTRLQGPARTRVFATTLGNATATLADPRYLDFVARGFLWALGEDTAEAFRSVPPGESLAGLELPPLSSEPPPLRLGSNPAWRGEAEAFSWESGPDYAAADAALAVDGDPATAWIAPGPGVWRVKLRESSELAAAAIDWQGRPPEEALLESSEDGWSWQRLATLRPAGAEATTLVHFDPVSASHLRISVPKGAEFALAEFAVYPNAEAVPAAVRLLDPSPPRLRRAGQDGLSARIHLAEGWRVGARVDLGVGGQVGQIVPTASGGVFLSVFPASAAEGSGEGVVLRASPDPDGALVVSDYLSGLPPGGQIAWDGEWLLTLSGARLDPVRRALGPGPADERGRRASVYSLPPDGTPEGFALRRLRVGGDGWLHAEATAARAGRVLDAEGRAVQVPRSGLARFRRDGRGLEIESADRLPSPGGLPDFGRVEGRAVAESDGERVWIAAEEGGGLRVLCLVREGDALVPGPLWDEIPSSELAEWIAGAELPSHRREAALEVLRRKRDPAAALEALLSAAPPGAAEALAAVASGLPRSDALDWLLRLSGLADPAFQAAAFRALGSHPDATDHPAFAAIGRTTEPEVSAALFDALRRSRSDFPGLEDLALALASHGDPVLSQAALGFLADREAADSAFAALDHDGRREQWAGAFALLGSLHRHEVVEGLTARIRRTDDPERRRLGLEALCRLHRIDGRETWSGSAAIGSFLAEAFGNHRVDHAALLTAMDEAGISPPGAEVLVRLARESLSFDAFAIAALLGEESSPSPETLEWLGEVVGDPSRDGDLRLRALALLVQHAPSGEYRRRFQETAHRDSIPALSDASTSLVRERWLARRDHGGHLEWLREQAVAVRGEAYRRLAEETLAGLGERPPSSAAASGEPLGGRELFQSLACNACHNLHGEGPVRGPDLYSAARSLSDEELAEALLHPGRRVAPGFEARRFERTDGRQFVGRVEERSPSSVLLADRAGNLLELPTAEIVREWPGSEAKPGCEAAAGLSEAEFETLLAFLRSLGDS